jgi:RHS repeat-associated protein
MRKLLLILVVLLSFVIANAQNPFAEYGYTPKIATLSQGQYNEFFDNDTLVQIGSVLFNTKSKQIVAFIETDTLYSEATLEQDIVSRWISPDPLSDRYPSWSPYNYTLNNPIKFIDPDGQKVVLAGWSVDQHVSGKSLMQIAATNKGGARLTALINNQSTFTVNRSWSINGNTYDPKSGNISYTSTYGTFYSFRETGSTNSVVRLGHEMDHAFDLKDVPFFIGESVANSNIKTLESKAVSFDNYLRDVYGITDKREKYTFVDGSSIRTPTNTNPDKEQITGFELLNFDATNPYSADLLSPNHPLEAKYQKKVGDGNSQTYWMRMSINKDNEISYQIFNTYEDLKK